MSDDAALDEFGVGSEGSNKSDTAVKSKQKTDDLQALEASPIEDWELLRLGDVLSFEYGDNLPADTREDGEIPVYGSNGQVDTHTEANVDTAGIIIGRKGSIGKGEFSINPFWAIDTTYYISDNETSENLRFVYYLLQNMKLERLNAASAIPGLNRNDAYNLNTLIPPLSEQQKIATVLRTVDQAIQKTEEIIEQTRRAKTGIQQELFTQGYYDHRFFVETRVGELPESWRLEKIKNHTELVSGAHVKSELVSDDSSLTPYLTGPEDFDELGFTMTKYTDEPTKFCKEGDTLVTVKGSGCGKSTFADRRACISRQLKALRPNGKLEELYLFYFVETKQKLLKSLAEGSAIPGLSNSHLTALDIPIPSIEEQRKVGEVLKKYDDRIVYEKKYKSQLQRLKHGLMQDLLSGDVRTADVDIEIPQEVA
ncbi:restriction endonuclease subunit S [Haloquadratum walsbyi]|uniref:Type I site-specific deoxyribonuclease subunit RmeS n=1 Tax=Haloquadratum walsbyi (strain DSM 16854 / JCM 12705 / C23) TaxID=768065 RepID=G0LND4_HALWC|nr:restriction endonuclease subunit S [Haloquadratum walsbyi]CCC41940.1 type I site-specific deoxyribonuclease subunit RmeS [Haloquadratum walsbyi C23]